MIDLEAIDWARLAAPSPMFRVFREPTAEQLSSIVTRLLGDYLYAPDELRDAVTMTRLVNSYWGGSNIIYEVGEFQGILGILDIVPEHKASVTLKLWGREAFGRNFVREARSLLALVMDSFGLVRLATETPDEPRVVPLAKLAGFIEEGKRFKDFRWNGKYYDTTVMGLVRE